MNYSDEQVAAKGLLGEVASVLGKRAVDFVVVGGWKPFLFNSQPIHHPGTFDVDILLNEATSRSTFDNAAQEFLRSGYMRAPKNQFQLHRILKVRDEPLVYHVDFLHRKYADDTDDMIRNWGKVQSIAGPGTDIIFTNAERILKTIDVLLPTGDQTMIPVSFCTDVGFLSAKGRSAFVPKRTRDAFDIFLVVKQSEDYTRLVTRSKELLENPIFKVSLDLLKDGFANGHLRQHAASYLYECGSCIVDAEQEVSKTMNDFFAEVGM